jgi:hypothetical protein
VFTVFDDEDLMLNLEGLLILVCAENGSEAVAVSHKVQLECFNKYRQIARNV